LLRLLIKLKNTLVRITTWLLLRYRSWYSNADRALSGITQSHGGGEAFNFNSGNKAGGGFGSMLGPALGLASAGIGLISGIGQQRTSASIAQAQLAAQNAAFLEGRERDKGALAGSLFNQIFGTGTGADLSFNREKAAKQFEVGPYAERLWD
jgi:hypothetical protein